MNKPNCGPMHMNYIFEHMRRAYNSSPRPEQNTNTSGNYTNKSTSIGVASYGGGIPVSTRQGWSRGVLGPCGTVSTTNPRALAANVKPSVSQLCEPKTNAVPKIPQSSAPAAKLTLNTHGPNGSEPGVPGQDAAARTVSRSRKRKSRFRAARSRKKSNLVNSIITALEYASQGSQLSDVLKNIPSSVLSTIDDKSYNNIQEKYSSHIYKSQEITGASSKPLAQEAGYNVQCLGEAGVTQVTHYPGAEAGVSVQDKTCSRVDNILYSVCSTLHYTTRHADGPARIFHEAVRHIGGCARHTQGSHRNTILTRNSDTCSNTMDGLNHNVYYPNHRIVDTIHSMGGTTHCTGSTLHGTSSTIHCTGTTIHSIDGTHHCRGSIIHSPGGFSHKLGIEAMDANASNLSCPKSTISTPYIMPHGISASGSCLSSESHSCFPTNKYLDKGNGDSSHPASDTYFWRLHLVFKRCNGYVWWAS
ncbi:uncharacterized protein [Procambarus clarkii]|uniref:uncharacterized protein isoform X2 n=1 Tax=Procambarus clarkii TaxID=6728 RepID=UPI003742E9C7